MSMSVSPSRSMKLYLERNLEAHFKKSFSCHLILNTLICGKHLNHYMAQSARNIYIHNNRPKPPPVRQAPQLHHQMYFRPFRLFWLQQRLLLCSFFLVLIFLIFVSCGVGVPLFEVTNGAAIAVCARHTEPLSSAAVRGGHIALKLN